MSQHPFKAGDIVRCVEGAYHLTDTPVHKGRIYRVRDAVTYGVDDYRVHLTDLNCHRGSFSRLEVFYSFFPHRFVLVHRPSVHEPASV